MGSVKTRQDPARRNSFSGAAEELYPTLSYKGSGTRCRIDFIKFALLWQWPALCELSIDTIRSCETTWLFTVDTVLMTQTRNLAPAGTVLRTVQE